jgi:hypothetical protein
LTNRFKARIAIGVSILPRRHAASHGAPHTQPQVEANGFVSRAIR